MHAAAQKLGHCFWKDMFLLKTLFHCFFFMLLELYYSNHFHCISAEKLDIWNNSHLSILAKTEHAPLVPKKCVDEQGLNTSFLSKQACYRRPAEVIWNSLI